MKAERQHRKPRESEGRPGEFMELCATQCCRCPNLTVHFPRPLVGLSGTWQVRPTFDGRSILRP
jgi:hypothetical protein